MSFKDAFFIVFVPVFIAVMLLQTKKIGYVDRFYPKFLKRSDGLILGSSRALYGINPLVIDKKILNFAFTMANSPYGEIYYNAIQKKVLKNSKNGKFILEVNPYVISTKNSLEALREEGKVLDSLYFFNGHNNLDYLFRFYEKTVFRLLYKNKKAKNSYKSGWLEDDSLHTSEVQHEKVRSCITSYAKVYENSKISEMRISYLRKTIKFLQQYGQVILVRTPISKSFYDLEEEYSPNFNTLMHGVSSQFQIKYLNLNKGNDKNANSYLIGCHHLNSQGANLISGIIKNEF